MRGSAEPHRLRGLGLCVLRDSRYKHRCDGERREANEERVHDPLSAKETGCERSCQDKDQRGREEMSEAPTHKQDPRRRETALLEQSAERDQAEPREEQQRADERCLIIPKADI